jgi:TonB family protein
MLSWTAVASGAGVQDPAAQLRLWAQAGETESVRELLAENEDLDVDAPGQGGWTALMFAAKAGHDDILLLLIDAGADIQRTGDAGETPLHIAATYGRTKTVRILLGAGADITVRDAEGHPPLYRAIENRKADVIEVLQAKAQSLADSGQSTSSASTNDDAETIPPKIVESFLAPYTRQARNKGIEGTVVLMVLVGRDGTLGGVSVSKSLEESLDRSALDTVKKWKFEPATKGGIPVDALLEIDIDFKLPEKR